MTKFYQQSDYGKMGGDLIEGAVMNFLTLMIMHRSNPRAHVVAGHIRLSKFGTRIKWKRHSLDRMPMGYGGCWVPQILESGV